MQTGNPAIRPFHFTRNTHVTVEIPPDWLASNPSSIFIPINGLSGVVVAESSTMEGYYHVRMQQGAGGFPADPLYLIPWALLQLKASGGAHVPG